MWGGGEGVLLVKSAHCEVCLLQGNEKSPSTSTTLRSLSCPPSGEFKSHTRTHIYSAISVRAVHYFLTAWPTATKPNHSLPICNLPQEMSFVLINIIRRHTEKQDRQWGFTTGAETVQADWNWVQYIHSVRSIVGGVAPFVTQICLFLNEFLCWSLTRGRFI